MARREEIALRVIRRLVRHPRLADAVFRFDRWGNILGPDRFVDPYPIYERMRASGPVSFRPWFQQWAVVGYAEAREVLRSPSFGVAGQMEILMDARPYSALADQTRALVVTEGLSVVEATALLLETAWAVLLTPPAPPYDEG